MRTAIRLVLLVLTLITASCSTFENRANGLQWVKVADPMPVLVWVVVDEQRLNYICGKKPWENWPILACIQRPTDTYGINGGGIVYSIYTMEEGKKVRGCDGMTVDAHERKHLEEGLNHTGYCTASVFASWQQ